MATYCFADGKYELFFEACIRGWLAGILDFPQRKNDEERIVQALQECDRLQSEVCCIQDSDAAYRRLVSSAWIAAYRATEDPTERLIAINVFALKGLSTDEALTQLRGGFALDDARVVIDQAYAQYQALAPKPD